MRARVLAIVLASTLAAASAGVTAAAPPQPPETVPAATPTPPTPAANAGLPADPAARVDALADAYVRVFFEHFPDQATAQGRADADNSRLPDNSLAGLDAWRDEEDALLDELDTVDRTHLTGRAVVTHDFLRELLEASIGARVCETELWNVSPTWTGWQANYTYLASVQPVGTAALRQAALSRLGQLPRYLDGETARLREGLRRGFSAPKGNVQRVIEQMDGLLGGTAAESPFYDPAKRDGDAAFGAALAKVIDEQAKPAIRRYRDFLAKEYLPAAREAIAVAANPQGKECYRAAVRFHTSTRMEPEEIHRLGLQQMERATNAMKEIGARSFGTSDPTALLAKVKQPPYTFTSRQQLIDYATAAVERARAAVPQWFGTVPKATVVVVPYPAFRERSAPGAEYQAGSDDGTRPGTYYINAFEAEKQSKAGIEATAFHETYPGHHLQGSVAKEVTGTHPIQRYFGSSGFLEGWGLYSERLADEMGLYSDDVAKLGLLSNEALRSARLVVDSGMHALGWTRQQAIDYMLAHTTQTPERAAAEVDRYIAVPAQATAYMIGNLEIRRLREYAEKQLGERFDVKAFHDQVLGDGAVTLGMLDAKITHWVATERKKVAAGTSRR
ncbi:MAG TPA: DUF885 domain-containing protein [Thermoanaerobaculia bacterium]|jgi:uncharacterized protein (DUF885 family)|nr:DUF885 domain-containing protein [Thermoanaerobaculia bacterium]